MEVPVRYDRDQLSFVDDLITDVDILKLGLGKVVKMFTQEIKALNPS